MGAKLSEEMKRARELLTQGVSVCEAAKLCQISPSSIYMSKWYKEWKKNNINKMAINREENKDE